MSLLAIAVAIGFAVGVWRLVTWITKHKGSSERIPHTDNEPLKDKKTNTSNQSCGTINPTSAIGDVGTTINNSERTDKADLKLTPTEVGDPYISKSEATTNELHLQLCQERRLRETAEDWAEFLVQELESHIRVCKETDRKYRRLKRKLNSTSPEVLEEYSFKPTLRTFKDISEARQTWQNGWNGRAKLERKQTGKSTTELEHDESEWHQMVQANLRILQMTEGHKHKNETFNEGSGQAKSNQNNGQYSLKCCDQEDPKVIGKLKIFIEECKTPEEKQKNLEIKLSKAEDNDNNHSADFNKLRIPSQGPRKYEQERSLQKLQFQKSQITNQFDRTESENPLVCRGSLSDIKKTTQLWENISNSKERLESSEDVFPPSPNYASTTKGSSSCESYNDITKGLVKKNLQMWEN